MLLLLAILAGCDLTPMPKGPAPRPSAPARETPARKIPDAALGGTDVWEEGGGLIKAITYVPAQPTAFDDVRAEVEVKRIQGMDIDYAWTVNGRKLLSARDPVLPQTLFSKGDEVQVTIMLEQNGRTVSREGALLTIRNAPPRILTRPSTLTELDGFRVRGEDPDGGALSYRLTTAPPGLTIGERTGVFRYAPSKDAEGGRHEIRVVLADPDGAESEWHLVVTVRAGSESKAAKAKRAEARAAGEATRKAKMEGQAEGAPK